MLDFVEPLSNLVADAHLVAYFNGADEVAQLLPPAALTGSAQEGLAAPPPRPPLPEEEAGRFKWSGMDVWLPLVEEATKNLAERRLLTRDQYDQLDAEARKRAFTVAQLHTQEAIGAVQAAIVEAANAPSLREFSSRVDDALGASTLGPGHMENVFRTNIAASYSAGLDKIADHPIVNDAFPYEEVMPIRDSRLTGLCHTIAQSGINGTGVYRRDDPVYRKYRSPRHYQDRCGRRLLSVRDAARRGIEEAQEWLKTGNPPLRPQFVAEPKLAPDDLKMFTDFRGRISIGTVAA